jgi:hypothetical protein
MAKIAAKAIKALPFPGARKANGRWQMLVLNLEARRANLQ